MSRTGNGTYVAPTSSWNPAINGVTATSADWNALLTDLSAALTQSVSKDGQTAMTGNLPMGGFVLTGLGAGAATGQSVRWQQLFSQGTQIDLASATTTDIGAENTNFLNITGTTTITSLGTNYNGPRFLRFDGALTLTHNATTLILPGGANITTAAGDTCIAVPNSSTSGTADGWLVLAYQRANGGVTLTGASTQTSGSFTQSGSGSIQTGTGGLVVSGALRANGNNTLGDAAGDALLINSTAATLGGNLNIDSGTLFIDATNNRVGIGTTSPSVPLEVAGESIKSIGYFCRAGLSGPYRGNVYNIDFTSAIPYLYIDTTNLGQISIVSDRRIKKDIQELVGSWGRVKALRPVTYKMRDVGLWSDDGQVRAGFIADEVQDVIPSGVHGDRDALTSDGKIQPQSLNLAPIVAELTAALQEAMSRIEALEAK